MLAHEAITQFVARDAAGRSRLEDSSDFVRRELLGAQERGEMEDSGSSLPAEDNSRS